MAKNLLLGNSSHIYIYIYIEYLDSDLVRRGNIIYVCMSYGYFFITWLGRSLF